MTASWVLIGVAVLCILLAGACAQRELFARDRRIELRDADILHLHLEVELRNRKLEAEEILLRRLRDAIIMPGPEK